MNKIFNTLRKTEEPFKKQNDVTGKVNAERLQHAVVSVLLSDNEKELTNAELDVLYDEIDVNTGKNTKNPMRNKITGICKLYGMTNKKMKTQFFEKIIAFLEAEVNDNLDDLVDGDMLEKEKYTEMMGESDDEGEDEGTEDDNFRENEEDVSGFYVEGDNIENGWGLYI
jgi:hypothetical protein